MEQNHSNTFGEFQWPSSGRVILTLTARDDTLETEKKTITYVSRLEGFDEYLMTRNGVFHDKAILLNVAGL